MTQGFLNGVFFITVNKLSIVIHNLKNKLKKQNIIINNQYGGTRLGRIPPCFFCTLGDLLVGGE